MGVDLDDEILQVFLDESHEHLDGIETDLLTLEQSGENVDKDLLNAMFRAVHSVKGGAGFFGFIKIKDRPILFWIVMLSIEVDSDNLSICLYPMF